MNACGLYYLTYSAPGTQFRTYAMGTYVAGAPMGPFRYQERNPIMATKHGLIQGPGHGCIVRGPRDTLWAFHTCLVRNLHVFERRIGMDPAGLDSRGNLFVAGASSTPQWAPGVKDDPANGNATSLLPLSIDRMVRASSEAPGRSAVYAVDDSIRTWWEPAAVDEQPWLAVDLDGRYRVSAVRMLWAEPGLAYDDNILPGPFGYRIEVASGDDDAWRVALECGCNQDDLLIDYRVLPAPEAARRVRLVITGWPRGIRPAVLEFTMQRTTCSCIASRMQIS